MALIYRTILDVRDLETVFPSKVADYVSEWLCHKLDRASLELPVNDAIEIDGTGIEIDCRTGDDGDCRVSRISTFEGARDDGAEVKTTVTAIAADGRCWVWVDLERWTKDYGRSAWIPAPPGVVTSILRHEEASRGSTTLTAKPTIVQGDEGAALVDLIADRRREVPFVVVSYKRGGREGVRLAEERGRSLAYRLAGVGAVAVLTEGAVSAFSGRMLEVVGPDMDVHSGAVRTYLPGVGAEDDYPARHRFISHAKLRDRRPELPALMVAPALFRRAVEEPPPRIWRERGRSLIAGTHALADYEELLTEADREITALTQQVRTLEEDRDDEKESLVQLARQLDDLARRNRFLRDQLKIAAPTVVEPAEPLFDPQFPSEAVERAQETLTMVEIPEVVLEGAGALDEHLDESWASKGWLALRALDEYAQAKATRAFDGDFRSCCEKSATEVVVPAGWVVRTESKLTMGNRVFRELRRLPVSTEVDPSGAVIMEEHIKLEKGGTPSPRIHYYDDTCGATGKVHIGWFGDHLDSRAKP